MDKIVTFSVALLATLFISMALAYPMMILWNKCLLPAVPGLLEVEWLQMWGIIVLFKAFSNH